MIEIEQDLVNEIVEILETLTDDIPLRARNQLSEIIIGLKKPLTLETVLKIQDELEFFSNNSSIDSYTRNEVFNVLSMFETLI